MPRPRVLSVASAALFAAAFTAGIVACDRTAPTSPESEGGAIHEPGMPGQPNYSSQSLDYGTGFTGISKVQISRVFNSSHPWYQKQQGGTYYEDGNPKRYCHKSDIAQIETITRQHEGVLPRSAPSHVSAIQVFFRDADPQVAMEKVVAHEDELPVMAQGGGFGRYVQGEYLSAVYNPLQQDGRYRHTDQGGIVPIESFPCKPRFNL